MIKCPYNMFGCAEIINYDAYLKHALSCDYRSTYNMMKKLHVKVVTSLSYKDKYSSIKIAVNI